MDEFRKDNEIHSYRLRNHMVWTKGDVGVKSIERVNMRNKESVLSRLSRIRELRHKNVLIPFNNENSVSFGTFRKT